MYLFYIVTSTLPTYRSRFFHYRHNKDDPLPVAGKLFKNGIIKREEVAYVASCADYKEGDTFLLNAMFKGVDNEKLKNIASFLKPYSQTKKTAEEIKEYQGKYCIMVSLLSSIIDQSESSLQPPQGIY